MDAKEQKRPIYITSVGMDERMQQTLLVFFENQCAGKCVLAGEESADIAIIDMDGYRGGELCEEYRARHPGQPLVLLSVNDIEGEDIFIRKPLKAKELLGALVILKKDLRRRRKQKEQEEKKIVSGTKSNTLDLSLTDNISGFGEVDQENNKVISQHNKPTAFNAASILGEQSNKSLIGTAPEIDLTDSAQVANAMFDPQDFFCGHLQRYFEVCDRKNEHIRLDTPSGSIVLIPHSHRLIMSIESTRLKNLSSIPINDSMLSSKTLKGKYEFDADEGVLIGRESLLWQTALWAARGRVPIGTELNVPVFMRRWPNMTRMLLFPHAMRIAALWVNRPQSLVDTAKMLSIPQRYVFSLYSAANAVGFADTGKRHVDMLVETPAIEKSSRRSLFSRIMKHLRAQ